MSILYCFSLTVNLLLFLSSISNVWNEHSERNICYSAYV
uniref:Uncharacterized protein n=1 Tax=Rhizophora mucronata TaxID=61149 RepID=A0A2P2IMQ1_RHIMU